MSELRMHPATVTGWGSAAQSIGTDVAAVHSHVRSAGDDGTAANMAGFASHTALSSYADLFEGVVRSVGDEVHGTGTRLMSTAGVVTGTDGSNASAVSAGSGLIRSINATTNVAV